MEITLPAPGSWRRNISIRKVPQKILETVDIVGIGAEQESTTNDLFNDMDNDIAALDENTVAKPLTGKSAPDLAFNDNAGFNDKIPSFTEARLNALTSRQKGRRTRLGANRR